MGVRVEIDTAMAAKILGVSTGTVSTLVRQGRLAVVDPSRVVKGKIRFFMDVVEEFAKTYNPRKATVSGVQVADRLMEAEAKIAALTERLDRMERLMEMAGRLKV